MGCYGKGGVLLLGCNGWIENYEIGIVNEWLETFRKKYTFMSFWRMKLDK